MNRTSGGCRNCIPAWQRFRSGLKCSSSASRWNFAPHPLVHSGDGCARGVHRRGPHLRQGAATAPTSLLAVTATEFLRIGSSRHRQPVTLGQPPPCPAAICHVLLAQCTMRVRKSAPHAGALGGRRNRDTRLTRRMALMISAIDVCTKSNYEFSQWTDRRKFAS